MRGAALLCHGPYDQRRRRPAGGRAGPKLRPVRGMPGRPLRAVHRGDPPAQEPIRALPVRRQGGPVRCSGGPGRGQLPQTDGLLLPQSALWGYGSAGARLL